MAAQEAFSAKDVRLMIASLTTASQKILNKESDEKKDSNISGADQSQINVGTGAGGSISVPSATIIDSSVKSPLDWVMCDGCKKWRVLPARSHPEYPQLDDEK
jgi:hypothetical protein